MELQAISALMQERYRIIMEKFSYEGKEEEAKERLRYLLSNQRISFSSLAPEPKDWNAWMEECIRNADWPGLCRVMNQRGKAGMMPSIYGGYHYEKNFHCMLECFACGNILAMERILPPELVRVKNFHSPFFPVAAHMLIGLWQRDKAVLEWAVPEAERFLEKKSSLLEKAMLSFLLDLESGDMDRGSDDLLAVCKSYPRDQRHVLGVRPFCTLAHGLYCLAQILLPEDVFGNLNMPKYKNFISEFARWRREHSDPDLSLWFRYPEDMAMINGIYEAPPARLVLWQPHLDSVHVRPKERQDWSAHGVKWVDNYVDELWDMGVGREAF